MKEIMGPRLEVTSFGCSLVPTKMEAVGRYRVENVGSEISRGMHVPCRRLHRVAAVGQLFW